MQRSRIRWADTAEAALAHPRNQSVRLARTRAPRSWGGCGQCGRQGSIVILKSVTDGDSFGLDGWRCSVISYRESFTTRYLY